jgi:hypothetical protein
MHTATLKKLALALTFWLALHLAPLKAQLLGPYGTSPTTFEVDSNGLLSATGTFGTGNLSLSGAGTRMFWYPGKAAFRAGSITGTAWNDSNIGDYSVAFGLDTMASGYASTASGWQTSASGVYSTAMGAATTASGFLSTAMGQQTSASGEDSTAMGRLTSASDYASTAMGAFTAAIGGSSTAMGYWTTASGYSSTASGFLTIASGAYSTATGYGTSAGAQLSFVVGACNLGLSETGASPSPTTWVATDPLFEIGNGSASGYGSGYPNPAATGPSDALVVYKNGDTAVQGTVTAPTFVTTAPNGSGDIPMYTGN